MVLGLVLPTVLLVLAPARVFYASPTGSDSSDDCSPAAPLQTLAACVAKLRSPGDECRLLEGIYSEPTVVARGLPGGATVAAARGATVVIDGTAPLNGPWTQVGQGLWEMPVAAADTPLGGVTQIWLAGEMLTPSRWPNALWSEMEGNGMRAVFNVTHWASFDPKAPWSPANFTRGQPLRFVDRGGPGGLGSLGTSAVGSSFIGNIAHDDTFVGRVTAHTTGSNQFEVLLEASVNAMGNTKASNSVYFLEGGDALLDRPGEWSWNAASRKLRVRTPHGQSPAISRNNTTGGITHKVQTYALNISDSPNLTLSGLRFLGTTINAAGGIPHLTLDSLSFRYPSFSRRSLGELHTPDHTVISAIGGTPADPGNVGGRPAITAAQSSFVVRNCSFFGADGKAFTIHGTSSVFENNLFESNDWTCHEDDVHTGMGCVLLTSSGYSHDIFTRNTFIGNGPSVMYACGDHATMSLNYCVGQADIDNDGVCLQIRSSSAVGSAASMNWVTHSAKGFRLDSGSNTEFCPDEVNNTISGNVVMLTNGMKLKNDHSTYTNNLALWAPPSSLVWGGASRATEVFRVDSGRFKGESMHSIVEGNVASTWTTPLPGVTSPLRPNVLDKAVVKQMRDGTHGTLTFGRGPGRSLRRLALARTAT